LTKNSFIETCLRYIALHRFLHSFMYHERRIKLLQFGWF